MNIIENKAPAKEVCFNSLERGKVYRNLNSNELFIAGYYSTHHSVVYAFNLRTGELICNPHADTSSVYVEVNADVVVNGDK